MRLASALLAVVTAATVMVASLPAPGAEPQRGDLHLAYVFAPTGESIGYRLFVPSSYDPKKLSPLLLVLHGAGGDENAVFARGDLQAMAEKHGYLVLAVRGYTPFGGYGDIYPVVLTRETAAAGARFVQNEPRGTQTATPAVTPIPAETPGPVPLDDYAEQPAAALTTARISVLSEQETMAALEDVERHYSVDGQRTYLMGNSMGGVGTMYLAARYPERWAAISPQGGPIAAWTYPYWRLSANHIAVLFVHGESDAHSNPHWSQVLSDTATSQGVDARLIVVPRGSHAGAWNEVLPQIFDFFDQHPRATP